MNTLVYPAIFEPDHNTGGYCVYFPDLEGCITEGDTIEEAFQMAKEAMSGWLASHLEYKPAPEATSAEHIREGVKSGKYDDGDWKIDRDSIVLLIEVEPKLIKELNKKAVKVNTSIPAWMKAEADKQGLNISKILQAALLKEIENIS